MGYREQQYDSIIVSKSKKQFQLGSMINDAFEHDSKRLTFTFARYKFVSKMLAGRKVVLEIGCGDGFASKIVSDVVRELHLTDFDPLFVTETKKFYQGQPHVTVFQHDFTEGPISAKYDGIFALDVLEHIPPNNERDFLQNICRSLVKHGVCILGLPSLESQVYASEKSKQGHVNCKSGEDLAGLLKNFFNNVFIFSMNDEVIHTGFSPMAHYLLALCVSPINDYCE